MRWIIENWSEIIAAAGLLLAFSTVIARLTPSCKDDRWVEKARKFFEVISTLNLPDKKK